MEAYKHAITCAERGDVGFFKTVAREILLKARDRFDRSVLTVAALESHLDCCEVIVERCTPLLYHQEDYSKASVLHKVVEYEGDNKLENILRFLITADSKPDLERGGGAKIPNNRLLKMQNGLGYTALHWAVERRNHGATKLLLEADRDFDLLRMVDDDGETCLHIAADCGDHVSAKLILQAGPDNDFLKTMEGKSNQTALHIAVKKKRLAIVQLLLEADHSNDLLAVVDSHQRTALHYAVKQGNLDMVKLTCKAGLDKQLLSKPDSKGNTPLHLAAGKSNLEIVKFLIEGNMDIAYCANNSNQIPLLVAMHKAAAAGDGSGSDSLVICKFLLEKDPSQCTKLMGDMRWAPLHFAASYGLISVVQDIIRLCPDCINTVDFHGQNVLHIAADHGHMDVAHHFLESKDTDVVSFLISQDKDGNTPLHLAISKGNVEIVRLLLKAHPISEHGANISQHKPYMMAMGKILLDKKEECSRSDLELGGGPRIPYKRILTKPNKYGSTALHLAVTKRNHEVTKLLLEADSDFELLPMVDNEGRTCLHLAAEYGDHGSAELIIKARPDIEFLKMTTTTISKQTALHIAVEKENLVVVKLLLEAEHSNDLLAVVDSYGNTPLHLAMDMATQDGSGSDSKIICVLLNKDPRQCTKVKDKHEQPFIHVAVNLGLNDVVETILKSKETEATILNIQDKDGNTPLHIAALGQNKRMTLCLLYDARVNKVIENNKKEKAIDLINFPYDEAKARVYSLGHQSDLKDQSSFDLLVAALIATVSFTAGITVPGGYVSDGDNKGSAILLKATAFKEHSALGFYSRRRI